ncbi:hypothetical protein HELRODRAFT_186061 [Helobdella robusta]|uniref:Aminopeptidase P N-terminal domain-containing protein n=1 Tax=Helobdella robusta TaxID=6412 RepID=T1FNM1_HELRO|nr:hypothetical protein HELRODRAFT_186061 [Helobdella robusta]ESN93862.1 hypothetical protein HELRODRAFT_186061 [Helobdella robusta]
MILKRLLNGVRLNKEPQTLKVCKRLFGQPVYDTHPHVMRKDHVTPGISKSEYKQRRSHLWNNICKVSHKNSALAVISAYPKSYMAHDVPYPFRQNSDFLYLCGFQEPDSILVMSNLFNSNEHNKEDFKTIIFVPKRDKLKELWDGPRTGSERAAEVTGCDESFDVDYFDKFLQKILQSDQTFDLWYDNSSPSHRSHHSKLSNTLLKSCKVKNVQPTKTSVQNLRLIKSEAEIDLMKIACDIGSKSLEKVMRYSKPKIDESHLYAKMDFECRIHGAERLAYPPVVAGGSRANIIHYINNNQLVDNGDMVLMDAGCEYFGYCSDITRTWPVNGVYSTTQKSLYEALLEVQMSCISLCHANYLTLNQIFLVMLTLLGRQLQKLGIISASISEDKLSEISRTFCPHHVSHYLGMDVHDVDEMSRNIQLRPGMIVTIEPGIYIPSDRLDVPKDWRGVGIRIEDDILITKSGPLNLTEKCPKYLSHIENIINTY